MSPRSVAAKHAEPAGTADDGALRLLSMPRPRLRRRFTRGIRTALVVQTLLTSAVLLALQGPWRVAGRAEIARSVATMAASRLGSDFLQASNPIALEHLREIAAHPGIRFAAIVDPKDRVVMSSEPEGHSGSTLSEALEMLGRQPTSGSQPNVSLVMGHTLVIVAQIDRKPSSRLLLGVGDQGADRALIDGGIAIAVGFVAACLGSVPLVAWWIGRAAGVLKELHTSIRRMAAGQAPDPIVPRGDDEFAYLAIAFNSMAIDVTSAQRRLREANLRLEDRVKERTAQLEQARRELERNNDQLRQVTDTALRFTDDVAHEFRTPLAVILEFASLVTDSLPPAAPDDQLENLQFITDAARDLSNLVDDFLDTSRLRAGRLPVHRGRHAVCDIVDSAWTILEVKAAAREIRLQRRIPASLPTVLVDPDKVRRVLINLVVNAIKFSNPGGEVVVEAQASDQEVTLRVVDNGPGMSPEEVQSLFSRFQQTSAGERATSKGFGLGLSITADLVALNLGTINVASTPGKGSTFAFTVPIADIGVVLGKYLALRCGSAEHSEVGAALVRRSGGPGAGNLDDWIAELLTPADICVPCDDGESLLVVISSESVHDWVQGTVAPSDGSASLAIDVIGSWPRDGVTPSEIARLAAQKGVTCCG